MFESKAKFASKVASAIGGLVREHFEKNQIFYLTKRFSSIYFKRD